MRRGTFKGDCTIEKYRKAWDYGGLGKRVSCAITCGPILLFMFPGRMCILVLWVSLIMPPIYGVICPKTPILEAWMGVFKPNAQNINIKTNLHIIKTTASTPTKFCTTIKTTNKWSWMVPMRVRWMNTRWRTAAILQKNRQITICRRRLDRSS